MPGVGAPVPQERCVNTHEPSRLGRIGCPHKFALVVDGVVVDVCICVTGVASVPTMQCKFIEARVFLATCCNANVAEECCRVSLWIRF